MKRVTIPADAHKPSAIAAVTVKKAVLWGSLPELAFSAQPERLLRNSLITEMFNFNTLARFDGMVKTLPVLQPRLRFYALIGARQQ